MTAKTTETKVGVILLAGGKGSRMKAPIPKQFMELNGKSVARHSFDIFSSMPEIVEIVVVCDPSYHSLFENRSNITKLAFASPGARRQDSVYNGLQEISSEATLICVHDAARPLIDVEMVHRVINTAKDCGAAVVGMPLKFTVKESDSQGYVQRTLPREKIWEIQTPQVIRTDLLKKGFSIAIKNKMTVTDDVSLIELFLHPVKIVEGSYSNIKITTPEDLSLVEKLLEVDRKKFTVK